MKLGTKVQSHRSRARALSETQSNSKELREDSMPEPRVWFQLQDHVTRSE